MPVLEKHMKYGENIQYIKNNSDYFRHISDNTLYDIPKNFRIVKMFNGSDLDWYVLMKRNIILYKLSKLFNSTKLGWHPACGCDRGAIGIFNYQTDTSSNGVAPLIYVIPAILRAYLGNQQYTRFDRESYPNGEIIKELDIYETIANCKFDKEKDIFHCLLENSIIKDYQLDNALKGN